MAVNSVSPSMVLIIACHEVKVRARQDLTT